jgi:lactoylglutathione lyase
MRTSHIGYGVVGSVPDPPIGHFTMLKPPDGHRIELVQWPPGHADGIASADRPEERGDSNG